MLTYDVLSQRAPGAGDLDECWVQSGLEMVRVTLPWLNLPGIKAARAAAGDPDDGRTDGGNQAEIVRMVTTLFPVLTGKLRRIDGAAWTRFKALVDEGRPVSVATWSKNLPAPLRFGFDGFHRVTVVKRPNGQYVFANPLVQPYGNWIILDELEAIRDGVMSYGAAKATNRGAWLIAGLTDAEAFPLHPLYRPAVQKAVETATATVAAENKALKEQLAANRLLTASAVSDAESAVLSLGAFIGRFKEA